MKMKSLDFIVFTMMYFVLTLLVYNIGQTAYQGL